MAQYEVQIPQGTTVTVANNDVAVKAKMGELKRQFKLEKIKTEQADGVLTLTIENPKTKESAYLGSVAAHIKNMIGGVNHGYRYKLKILYKHFPINVSIEKDKVVIKNFAGEKSPRYANIMPGTKVVVKAEIIEVDGLDIEMVGQTAANIEQATRIKKKDIRVFQDGIYITSKGEEQ